MVTPNVSCLVTCLIVGNVATQTNETFQKFFISYSFLSLTQCLFHIDAILKNYFSRYVIQFWGCDLPLQKRKDRSLGVCFALSSKYISKSSFNTIKRRVATSPFQLILRAVCCLQRLARKGKQIWPSARAQLVSYCNAVVAPVERICQICKQKSNVK